MRISDWSSDVCSSDLTYNADYFSDKRWKMYVVALEGHNGLLIGGQGQIPKTKGTLTKLAGGKEWDGVIGDATANYGAGVKKAKIGRASCRERGCTHV